MVENGYVQALQEEIEDLECQLTKLRGAVSVVYYAARWHPDTAVINEDEMWENLRKAAGIPHHVRDRLLGTIDFPPYIGEGMAPAYDLSVDHRFFGLEEELDEVNRRLEELEEWRSRTDYR
jgi:hypothetical protein